jgi:transcriptional regulator GlxA family with amidase domain
MTRNVGIFLFDDVEVLDFAGPFEVFSTASRVKLRLEPGGPEPFRVFTVARKSRGVIARGGLLVTPYDDFENHDSIDVLLIPGGIVTTELERPEVISWIAKVAQKADITASVCTGAFLLAKAGLLDGKSATTHWEDIAALQDMFPKVTVKENTRWVDEGNIVTAAGISAGIDMSLHLVARLEGEALARKTARQMEFDWTYSASPGM